MKEAIGGLLVALCFGLSWGCGSDDDKGGSSASCRDTCAKVVQANCLAGPDSVEECQLQCDQFAAKTACSGPYAVLQSCAMGKAIVCDPQFQIPTPEGCTDEEQDFISCYAQNS